MAITLRLFLFVLLGILGFSIPASSRRSANFFFEWYFAEHESVATGYAEYFMGQCDLFSSFKALFPSVADSTAFSNVLDCYCPGHLSTSVLASVPSIIIAGVLVAAIFTVLALSIMRMGMSKAFAATFLIHGYSQWIWHYLGLAGLNQTQLILFPIWHFALLWAWYVLTLEMLVTSRVMISSTIKDLVQEREAVDRALRKLKLEGFRSEKIGSRPYTPKALCALWAEQCHIFILIIGERYGYVIKSLGISVVEFEYQVASAQNSQKILVYVKDGVKREPRLKRFLKRLEDFEGGHFRSLFTTPEDLYEAIQRDVAEWLALRRLPPS